MKKVHFKSKAFFYCLIAIISLLLIWNLCLAIYYVNIFGLIPISIQTVLLALILMKNRYAKLAIKIWAITFLVLAHGLKVVGRALQDLVENFENAHLDYYLTNMLPIVIGLLLVIYAGKTIEIVEIQPDKNAELDNTVS